MFKTLATCILVLTFILASASAYRQYQATSALAELSDATSALLAYLITDKLALEDNLGFKRPYIVDPHKLTGLKPFHEFGGENFEFQTTVRYLEEEEHILGPYGPVPPPDKSICSIEAACAVWVNGQLLAGKLEVKAWGV